MVMMMDAMRQREGRMSILRWGWLRRNMQDTVVLFLFFLLLWSVCFSDLGAAAGRECLGQSQTCFGVAAVATAGAAEGWWVGGWVDDAWKPLEASPWPPAAHAAHAAQPRDRQVELTLCLARQSLPRLSHSLVSPPGSSGIDRLGKAGHCCNGHFSRLEVA